MKTSYDSEHDCRPEGHPSHFPGRNPFLPFGNSSDSGRGHEAKLPFPATPPTFPHPVVPPTFPCPGVPSSFPWHEMFPRSSTTFLETLLDIPDVAVENAEMNGEGDLVITVRSTVDGTRCNKCGREIFRPHGHGREIVIRHLSVFGRRTHIRIRPPRCQCVHCEGSPVTTQKLSWRQQRSPHATAFENHVLLQLVGNTVWDVSVREQLGYEAVMGIMDRRIDTRVRWDEIGRIDTIGTDEISLKKGHRNFVTIVTALADGELMILAVLPDREKKTVRRFFKSIPKRLRKRVRTVCSDMYEGFVNAAREVFGKRTRIVIDRFHVARLYRGDLDELRKSEMKRLKAELSDEEYGRLKGAMWALRKNPKRLESEDAEVLERLSGHSPKLEAAYWLCHELTEIFEEDISKSDARRRISNWRTRVRLEGLSCHDKFLKTLEKWSEEMTNYFVDRRTSGFVEGLNNKIKVTKRRCYGILNVDHLFQRIFLDIRGYALFARS